MNDWHEIEFELKETLAAFGDFNNHVVLCGGAALFVYYKMSDAPLLPFPTRDKDFILDRQRTPGKDRDGKMIADKLKENGFDVQFRSLTSPPVIYWTRADFGQGSYIEFLTDNRTRNREKVAVEEISGV